MSVKLTYVKLYAPLFLPSLGSLKETLPPDKLIPGFEMYLLDNNSIQLKWGSKGEKGAYIGPSGWSACVRAPEAPKAVPSVANSEKSA